VYAATGSASDGKKGKDIGFLPLRLNITQKTKAPCKTKVGESGLLETIFVWQGGERRRQVVRRVGVRVGRDGVDAVGLGWLERMHVFTFIIR